MVLWLKKAHRQDKQQFTDTHQLFQTLNFGLHTHRTTQLSAHWQLHLKLGNSLFSLRPHDYQAKHMFCNHELKVSSGLFLGSRQPPELMMQCLTILLHLSDLHTWPPCINHFPLISRKEVTITLYPVRRDFLTLAYLSQWRKWAALKPGFVNTRLVLNRVSCGAPCSHYTDHERGDAAKFTSSYFKYFLKIALRWNWELSFIAFGDIVLTLRYKAAVASGAEKDAATSLNF